MSSVLEQLMPAVAFVLFALTGAAETVAASAVAAATAANSGNDLAFLMYELLLGGNGALRSLERIGREMRRIVGIRAWRARRPSRGYR